MDAQLQGVEVETLVARDHDLAVDHTALLERRRERVYQLREVTLEGQLVSTCNMDAFAVAEDDGPESVPFGLVNPPGSVRDLALQPRQHGCDRWAHGQHQWNCMVVRCRAHKRPSRSVATRSGLRTRRRFSSRRLASPRSSWCSTTWTLLMAL